MRRLVGLIAAIAMSFPCFAQTPPNISMTVTTATAPLSPEQQALVAEYAKVYAAQLTSADPNTAISARSRLVAPLNAPGTTDVFRDSYAAILLPELEPIVEDQANAFAAINAMQLAAQLKTNDALRLALEHLNINSEPRQAIRLWAAITVREATAKLVTNQIYARTVDSATRALARAAESETDWLVLMRELQALGNLNTATANTEELNVLNSVVDRMTQQDEASDIVHAILPAVISLRDRMLAGNRIPPAQLAAIGKRLGPILGKVFEHATVIWNDVQDDQAAHTTYGKLISVTEQTIRVVDKAVQPPGKSPPSTDLKASWDRKDLNRYEGDLKQWMQRLDAPPYEKP